MILLLVTNSPLTYHYLCYLFLQNMTTENVSLSELLLKVMNAHQAKVGMSTCQSELGYIEQAAKLQGYGQESFPAKVS